MNEILIPMIRKIIPGEIAKLLTSVQPMAGIADLYSLAPPMSEDPPEYYPRQGEYHPKQGDKRHAANRGWQRYYGDEWVDDRVWWRIRVKGL
jgi:hypothetical protein